MRTDFIAPQDAMGSCEKKSTRPQTALQFSINIRFAETHLRDRQILVQMVDLYLLVTGRLDCGWTLI
jgi:hypothetical protein